MFSITIYIIECVVMITVFGILVFGMLLINPVSFVSDYPPEIQEEYYRSQCKEEVRKKLNAIMIIKKVAALIALTFTFAWMAHLANYMRLLDIIFHEGYNVVVSECIKACCCR